MNGLASRQQFLDLIRYLREIADGGPERGAGPSTRSVAGRRAEAPRLRVEDRPCRHDRRPRPRKPRTRRGDLSTASASTATARRTSRARCRLRCRSPRAGSRTAATRTALYRTLTHGFGQMPPQTWMVPSQKYDVIHYIREAFLKRDNPTQFALVDRAYLGRPAQRDDARPRAVEDRAMVGDGLRPDPDRHLRGGRRRHELRLQGGRRPARRRARGASRAAGTGLSSTTTRCAWRLPGAATASSTGTGSTSTAGMRSTPGSSAWSSSPTRSAPAGRIRRPARSTTRASKDATAGRTARCPGRGPITAGSTVTATRSILVVHRRQYRRAGDAGGRDRNSAPVFTPPFDIGPRDERDGLAGRPRAEGSLHTLASGDGARGRGRLPRPAGCARKAPTARRRSEFDGQYSRRDRKARRLRHVRRRLHDRRAVQDAARRDPVLRNDTRRAAGFPTASPCSSATAGSCSTSAGSEPSSRGSRVDDGRGTTPS